MTSQTELAIAARAITANVMAKPLLGDTVNLATEDNALRLQVPSSLFPFLQEGQVVFLSLTLLVATVKPTEEPKLILPDKRLLVPGKPN